MLARGELQTIGATTLDEYRKHLEKDAALERRFQPIQVAEPTLAHTIEILKGLRDRYEAHHRVSITDGALVAAATLADRYISDRFLPDKAIDLIDEAGSRMRIRRMTAPPDLREFDERIASVRREKESAIDAQDFEKAASLRDREKTLLQEKAQREKEWKAGDMDVVAEVDEELIAEVLATATGIPVFKLTEEESQRLLRMEDELHSRVIGQQQADQGAVPGDPAHPGRAQGPEASRWLVHLRRPVRRREDRAVQDARRVPVRRRGLPDPARHVGVLREAHRVAAVRLAARLRRLRGGRPAHREGAPQAVLGRALRRGREGPPGHLQLAAADPRGRSPDRLAGPGRRLQEHRDHHDHEPRHPRHLQGLQPRVRGRERHQHRLRADEVQGPGRAQAALPAGVPQPHRRHRRVPPAHARTRSSRSST